MDSKYKYSLDFGQRLQLWNLDCRVSLEMVKSCFDEVGVKKGRWTAEEDYKLKVYIERHGHGNWRLLPKKAGLLRCGKGCRFRWMNYLRPDIKQGNYSKNEEEIIMNLQNLLGNRWSTIASRLPGRTDNEIKNYWHTHLKKRMNENEATVGIKQPSVGMSESNEKNNTILGCPGNDPPSPQHPFSDISSGTGSSSITGNECDKIVVDQFMKSDQSDYNGVLSSQALLAEVFNQQEDYSSTFQGLEYQRPLSPLSSGEYNCLEMDLLFNTSLEGGEFPYII